MHPSWHFIGYPVIHQHSQWSNLTRQIWGTRMQLPSLNKEQISAKLCPGCVVSRRKHLAVWIPLRKKHFKTVRHSWGGLEIRLMWIDEGSMTRFTEQQCHFSHLASSAAAAYVTINTWQQDRLKKRRRILFGGGEFQHRRSPKKHPKKQTSKMALKSL